MEVLLSLHHGRFSRGGFHRLARVPSHTSSRPRTGREITGGGIFFVTETENEAENNFFFKSNWSKSTGVKQNGGPVVLALLKQ